MKIVMSDWNSKLGPLDKRSRRYHSTMEISKQIISLDHLSYSSSLGHVTFLFPEVKSVLKGTNFVSLVYGVKKKTADLLFIDFLVFIGSLFKNMIIFSSIMKKDTANYSEHLHFFSTENCIFIYSIKK